jgi:hypothetical protein
MYGHPLNELLAELRAAVHASETQAGQRRRGEASSRAPFESESSVPSQSHGSFWTSSVAILTAARAASGM